MFIGVLAVVTALIIFFGAWAVSADVGNERTLAFGLPGTTPSISGNNLEQGDQITRLNEDSLASDTWWGNAFLSACPLH